MARSGGCAIPYHQYSRQRVELLLEVKRNKCDATHTSHQPMLVLQLMAAQVQVASGMCKRHCHIYHKST
jgi:hypothetical protein